VIQKHFKADVRVFFLSKRLKENTESNTWILNTGYKVAELDYNLHVLLSQYSLFEQKIEIL